MLDGWVLDAASLVPGGAARHAATAGRWTATNIKINLIWQHAVRIRSKPEWLQILRDQCLQQACEIVAQNMHHDYILTWVGGRLPGGAVVNNRVLN